MHLKNQKRELDKMLLLDIKEISILRKIKIKKEDKSRQQEERVPFIDFSALRSRTVNVVLQSYVVFSVIALPGANNQMIIGANNPWQHGHSILGSSQSCISCFTAGMMMMIRMTMMMMVGIMVMMMMMMLMLVQEW